MRSSFTGCSKGTAAAWVAVLGRNCFSGLKAKQIADALYGGVGIGLGVFRQELVRDQRSVGAAPDHVGKGAAAVDPEVPKLR